MASSAGAGAAGGSLRAAAAAAFKSTKPPMNPYWRGPRKQRAGEKLFLRNLARARGARDHTGAPIHTPYTWNIVRGDLVQVTHTSPLRDAKKGRIVRNEEGQTIAQSWMGQQGEVLKVLRNEERIIVKGVNMKTRIMRPNEQSPGYFYQLESPIPYNHVTLVNPATGQPVTERIVRRRKEGQKDKERYSGSTLIPLPLGLKPVRSRVTHATDTAPQDVTEETYVAPWFTRPRAKKNADGSDVVDPETGLLEIEEEDMELRAARIKF